MSERSAATTASKSASDISCRPYGRKSVTGTGGMRSRDRLHVRNHLLQFLHPEIPLVRVAREAEALFHARGPVQVPQRPRGVLGEDHVAVGQLEAVTRLVLGHE